jgi:hypothetical protein
VLYPLIVRRAGFQKARPNWPPGGWETDFWPQEYSPQALRQWLDFVAGPHGVLEALQEPLSWEPNFRPQKYPHLGSPWVRDTWRYIERLKRQGLLDVPHKQKLRDYDTHEALVVLTKLRERLRPQLEGTGNEGAPGRKTPGKKAKETRDQAGRGEADKVDPTRLNEREREILSALLRLNANTERYSVDRLKAAKTADKKGRPSSYYKAIASLVKNRLVRSQKGPGGGIWLTPDGVRLAQVIAASGR